MTKLLKLAWRDVWRNRRRTFLTMGAIVFAVVVIGLANAVQYGTYDAMEEISARLLSGDLQVHRAGYFDDPTLTRSLDAGEQDWAALAALPGVEAAARRLTGFGLVSGDSASAGALILGIEPEHERATTTFSDRVVEGRPLAEGDAQAALLGRTLARNLGVGVGDTVAVLTQGYQNAMGADLYAVQGLLATGTPDVDRQMLVLPLPDAQFLFSMDGRFTELVLRVRDFQGAEAAAARVREALGGGTYEVMPWRDLAPELQQLRALDDAGNLVFYLFLILLVGFEIFNTTTMSMMERVREFGVMLSLGMKPRQVSLLIGMELVLKVVLGLGLGLAITFVLVFVLKDNPIPLGEEMARIYEEFGFTAVGIVFSPRPVIYVMPLVSMALISLLAMVYPILKMRTFSPVTALRTT